MTIESRKLRVLVVEDDDSIRRAVVQVLQHNGYDVAEAADGNHGLEQALTNSYDILLLDVLLPGINGFDICAQVRNQLPEQPILLLTAKDTEQDILEGFHRGADDYVTKPFRVPELVARVHALLRRAARTVPPARHSDAFDFGAWQIVPERLVAIRANESIEITQREADMLALFAREAGRIVSRRMLLWEIWGFRNPERIETRTVDMHIAKLRKKLDNDGAALIETVRGEGYRYRVTDRP